MNGMNHLVHKAMVVAAMALPLAGCGSDNGPKTAEEVKQEAAQIAQPTPGEYRNKIEITRLDVPGMPPEAAEQMKAMMKAAQENTVCLTKAQTDKGFKDMFKDIGKGDQCTYTKFEVDGGKLDAQMDCNSAQGAKSTMKMNGTVSSTGSDVTVMMDTSGGPPPMSEMKMTMHAVSERIGECKAS